MLARALENQIAVPGRGRQRQRGCVPGCGWEPSVGVYLEAASVALKDAMDLPGVARLESVEHLEVACSQAVDNAPDTTR